MLAGAARFSATPCQGLYQWGGGIPEFRCASLRAVFARALGAARSIGALCGARCLFDLSSLAVSRTMPA